MCFLRSSRQTTTVNTHMKYIQGKYFTCQKIYISVHPVLIFTQLCHTTQPSLAWQKTWFFSAAVKVVLKTKHYYRNAFPALRQKNSQLPVLPPSISQHLPGSCYCSSAVSGSNNAPLTSWSQGRNWGQWGHKLLFPSVTLLSRGCRGHGVPKLCASIDAHSPACNSMGAHKLRCLLSTRLSTGGTLRREGANSNGRDCQKKKGKWAFCAISLHVAGKYLLF